MAVEERTKLVVLQWKYLDLTGSIFNKLCVLLASVTGMDVWRLENLDAVDSDVFQSILKV